MAKSKPSIKTTKVPILEVFQNPYPGRNYEIKIESPEFTSVCPKTGQPYFGTVPITYIPGRFCIELKSLKMYLQKYRNEGIFYEDVTNRILDDLVAACSPLYMKLVTQWKPRGGITTDVTAVFEKKAVRRRKKQGS